MDQTQISKAKSQLAQLFKQLEDERANPYRGTAFETLADEIKTMRRTYGMSYAQISAALNKLDLTPKLQTTVSQVRGYCRHALGAKATKTPKRAAAQS